MLLQVVEFDGSRRCRREHARVHHVVNTRKLRAPDATAAGGAG